MFKAPKLNIGFMASLPKCFSGSCFPETHCNNWCITHLTWSCRHFSEQHSTSWIFSPAATCPHRLSLTSVRHAEWAATTLHLHKAHLTATSFMLLSLSMEIDMSLGILLMIPKGMTSQVGVKEFDPSEPQCCGTVQRYKTWLKSSNKFRQVKKVKQWLIQSRLHNTSGDSSKLLQCPCQKLLYCAKTGKMLGTIDI